MDVLTMNAFLARTECVPFGPILNDKASHFGCADFNFETLCRCCPAFLFSLYFNDGTCSQQFHWNEYFLTHNT